MNKGPIRSIGFHDVKVTRSSPAGSKLYEISSSMLCNILKVSQSVLYQAVDCRCLPFRKKGWRLTFNDSQTGARKGEAGGRWVELQVGYDW